MLLGHALPKGDHQGCRCAGLAAAVCQDPPLQPCYVVLLPALWLASARWCGLSNVASLHLCTGTLGHSAFRYIDSSVDTDREEYTLHNPSQYIFAL